MYESTLNDTKVLVFNQDFEVLPFFCLLEIFLYKPADSMLTKTASMFISFDLKTSFWIIKLKELIQAGKEE